MSCSHPVVERARDKSTGVEKKISAQFLEAFFQKPAFRLLLGQGKGLLVGLPGVVDPAQLPVQICPCRMGKVVRNQITACQDGLDPFQAGFGTIAHGDGHGAIEFDNG